MLAKCFVLGGMCGGTLLAQGQVGAKIPPAHGTLLTGAAVDLPAGLGGKTTVMVIGFSKGSREEVGAWGKRLASDYRGVPGVQWFEMAELESVPKLLRGWVTKQVKESVSAQGQATFLLVTDHEREWKQAAGFGAADDAYVLVVDAAGTVRYRTQGAVNDAVYDAIRKQIDGLKTP